MTVLMSAMGRKRTFTLALQNERMRASIDRGIGWALWGLLLAGGAWAAYSSLWFLWLAHNFHSTGSDRGSVLADIQGYAVVFGPMVVAAVLIAARLFRRLREKGR